MCKGKSILGLMVAIVMIAACGSDDGDGANERTTDEAPTSSTGEPTAPDAETAESDDTVESDDTAEAEGTDPTSPESSPSTEPSAPEGDVATILRSRFQADPSVLDPIYVANYADGVNAQVVFDNLVEGDLDGEGLINVLAERYEPAADGLSIDFALKQGVQFHDGYGELTAEDVKFSLERAAGIVPSDVES